MPFQRGRAKTGGRKVGVANRLTGTFRDAVQIAYNEAGGHEAFTEWAKKNRTEFYKIASRLIPVEVKNTTDATINVIIQRDPKRPASQATRDDVTLLYPQYGRYLGGRLGDATVEKLACAAGEFAASVLPDSLPLVVGHGDYAPRNVLVVDQSALAVLDPMPRWRVPRFEDIARFTVGMRLVAPQIYSLGGAFSRGDLDRREADFLAGYHGDEPIPVQAIRSYQALIVMDKWAALVSSQRASHSRLRRGVFWAFNRYLRGEASRLLTPDDGAVAS